MRTPSAIPSEGSDTLDIHPGARFYLHIEKGAIPSFYEIFYRTKPSATGTSCQFLLELGDTMEIAALSSEDHGWAQVNITKNRPAYRGDNSGINTRKDVWVQISQTFSRGDWRKDSRVANEGPMGKDRAEEWLNPDEPVRTRAGENDVEDVRRLMLMALNQVK